MANKIIPVQMQYTTLAGSGCTLGATSIILTSFDQIDGTALTMASFGQIGYITLEPSNSTQEEQISFTGITQNSNGTATLTGVKTVLFISPFTETSGTAKAHPGGSKAIVSNTSAFYNSLASELNTETISGIWTFTNPNVPRLDVDHTYGAGETKFLATKKYVDDTALAGASKADASVYGVTRLSADPAVAATPIAVGDNDIRFTTKSGTTLNGTTNKVIDSAYVSSQAVTGLIVQADALKLPALSGIQLVSTNIAGMYIASQAPGDIIYKYPGAGWARLGAGTAGLFLQTQGAATPSWARATHLLASSGAQVAIAGSASTAEQTVFTTTVPANALGTTGAIRAKMFVSNVRYDAGTFTMKLYYGTTVVSTVAITRTDFSGASGILDMAVIANAATNAQGGMFNLMTTNAIAQDNVLGGSTIQYAAGTATEDSTTALTFKLTVQWSSTDANNYFKSDGYIIEIV